MQEINSQALKLKQKEQIIDSNKITIENLNANLGVLK